MNYTRVEMSKRYVTRYGEPVRMLCTDLEYQKWLSGTDTYSQN